MSGDEIVSVIETICWTIGVVGVVWAIAWAEKK